MEASATGDNEARERFDACFRAHYPDVLAYALRRLGDRGTADDVASEAFVVAWRHRAALPAEPLAWLIGIARNVMLNELRAERRRTRLETRLGTERAAPPGDPAEIVSERTAILTALKRLSEPDREALMLAAWEGLRRDQAAAVLGSSKKAYAIRLYRARRRLAKHLAAGPSTGGDTTPVRTADLTRENAR